jgi:hypothetical protein
MQIQTLKPNDVTLALANKKTQKNTRISNDIGLLSFGIFPANKHDFPVGNVYLRLGFIGFSGARKGAFGLRHIWEKHGSELGLTAPKEVPGFIDKILVPGAEVIIDNSKDPDKPVVVESSNGLITLGLVEPKNEDSYYHIITAYSRKNHPGTVIAEFLK